MRYCSVCKKPYYKGDGNVFQVPSEEAARKKWERNCGRSFKKASVVCAAHFLPSHILHVGPRASLLPNAEPFVLQVDEPEVLTENAEEIGVDDVSLNANKKEQETQIADDVFRKLNRKDQETQTDSSIFAEEYFKKIRQLEGENAELKRNLNRANVAVDSLKKIFTEGQVRKLMTGVAVLWRWKDISNAICLHAAGPRAYRHLYKKGFPLPHVSTLQRWCAKIEIKEGVLNNSINFMRQTTYLSADEKICVLAFDEMKIAETYEYDSVNDTVRKPVNYVQVVIARGLRKSWKQPVFYDYDCKMTKGILNNIICELYRAGFPVVAIVCDMGPTNRKLWKDLGITTDKPWFPNPARADEKVFTFADVPHLLKLVRNHYLDTGLKYKNEMVCSKTIVELRKLTANSDLSITFKLTDEHITVKGARRQKVKLAAQLFSHTTANAIRRCYSHGMELYKPTLTADFIQLVNDWFDVHNSKLGTFKYPGKEPYGIALESQNRTLNAMNEFMSSPIIPNKNTLEHFQKGILISNSALAMLLKYVEKYNMTYLLTNRLNQDILENFFGAIRSKGGLNDHPSPMDFKYRLRKYILARNTEHLNGKGNVEEDNTEWINSSNADEVQNPCRTDNVADTIEPLPTSNEEDELECFDDSNIEDVGLLQEDALEYISGYIIRKLNLEGYECNENSFSWVDQVSKVSLKKPKNSFLAEIKKLEVIFGKMNGKEILHCPQLKKTLLEHSNSVDLPEHIKQMFFKCRIYFRIRHLNQRLKMQKSKQRFMGFSKLLKIKF